MSTVTSPSVPMNWTEIGEPIVEKIGREAIMDAIDLLEWQPIPEHGSLTLGAMPGMAINAAIRQLELPRVTRVAVDSFDVQVDGEDGYYPGFYGIESNFTDGRCFVFVVDEGHALTPVCSVLFPAENDLRWRYDRLRSLLDTLEDDEDGPPAGVKRTEIEAWRQARRSLQHGLEGAPTWEPTILA